jgi:hypothetical protein
MTKPAGPVQIHPVIGEVVEVYQKAGVPIAKVALRMCRIEIPMEMLDDAHLGDRILLEGELSLNHIESLYTSGPHTEPENQEEGDF